MCRNVMVRARTDATRAVGEVLLDQSVCSGIGNIYKCESLFAVALDPWAPVDSIDDAALEKLYRTARRLMRESAYGMSGRPRRAVHGRGGRPCRRCAHMIQMKPQGAQGRITYWCPHCQPTRA